MPVVDWSSPVGGLGTVIDWSVSGATTGETVAVVTYQFLHAGQTSTLYHAEGTTGESTPVAVVYNIVDEVGNQLVDEVGNHITTGGSVNAILMHAKETDTLYHAEA